MPMKFLEAVREHRTFRFVVWLDTSKADEDGEPDPDWVTSLIWTPGPDDKRSPDACEPEATAEAKRWARGQLDHRLAAAAGPQPLAVHGEQF